MTVYFLISIFFDACPLHFLKDLVIGSNSFLVFLWSRVVLNSMYASLPILIQFKRYKVLSLSISFPDTTFNRFLLPDISKGLCVSAKKCSHLGDSFLISLCYSFRELVMQRVFPIIIQLTQILKKLGKLGFFVLDKVQQQLLSDLRSQ